MSGIWWEGHKCQKCGATLLKSGNGNIWCSLVGCDYSRSMTRFEQITASPEALAKLLCDTEWDVCSICPEYPESDKYNGCMQDCLQHAIEWLNQPAQAESEEQK